MANAAVKSFLATLVVLGLLALFLPPKWFLSPGSLTYDMNSREFTYVRDVATLASLRYDCADPHNFAECTRLDRQIPLVFVDYNQNVIVVTDDDGISRECDRPLAGTRGRLWIQYEPLNTVRYKAPELDECMQMPGTAVMITRRTVRLFDMFPLFWPQVTQVVFPEWGVGDPDRPVRVGLRSE